MLWFNLKKNIYLAKNTPMKRITLILLLISSIVHSQEVNTKIQNYLNDNRDKLSLTSTDINDWIVESTASSESTGINNYYVKQRHQGIEIFQSLSNFWIKNDKVINGGAEFIPNVKNKINTTVPTINVLAGFSSTLSMLNEPAQSNILILENDAYHFKLSNGSLVNDPVSAKLVYHLLENNTLRLAWDYNFYSQDKKHLWSIRLDAVDNKILEKHDWIISCNFEHDTDSSTLFNTRNYNAFSYNFFKSSTSPVEVLSGSYRVFPRNIESPSHGVRELISTPHNLLASPYGWHDVDGIAGAEYTATQGNNTHVQDDIDGTNSTLGTSPDGGAGLLFDFPYLGNGSNAVNSIDAAGTNLFYMNNIMHDVWYQYGFNELNGNFQANNYTRGGSENDYVVADVQDSSSINNANFSTPVDGTSGRMQMFLWNNVPSSLLTITSPTTLAGNYAVRGNAFTLGNIALPVTPLGITQNLVLFNDAAGDPNDGCSAATNAAQLNGKIAVIRRSSSCTSINRVLAAQNAGAIAVIVVNDVNGNFTMTGSSNLITIPAVSISQTDGEAIMTALFSGSVSGKLSGPAPFIAADGSFDNGIVSHEYGHGISTRLAGGRNNSSCLQNAEQMGEGWSDWFWLMMQIKPTDNGTEKRGIGTFVRQQPTDAIGIRSYQYSTDMNINPFTFASTNGEVVPHGVGSVWATTLWDLTWAYIQKYGFDSNIYTGTGGNNKVMRLVLDGLKLQPCSPTFVQARNALIAADQATTGGQDYCMIWKVFAKRGLGVNASSGLNSSSTDQSEDFVEPAPGPNCTTLGLNYFENEDLIAVYPNPSNGLINIKINQFNGKVNLQVVDLNGRVVYSVKETEFNIEKTIDLHDLQSGMYIVTIEGEDLKYTKKIILN